MNKEKAIKRIQKKMHKAKPCPFCGKIPKFSYRCDSKHSEHGSFGHFTSRQGCCRATGCGQTELFFCNNFAKPNYSLWSNMFNRLVDDWNRRT